MNILTEQKDLTITPLGPSPAITQVDKSMPPTEGLAVNGRFAVATVDGVDFKVTSSSKVCPVDGNDVNSQSFGYLLAAYPMYNFLYFNPLLTASDLGNPDDTTQGVDFSATFKDSRGVPPLAPKYYANRLQTGREIGSGKVSGNYPTHTALLPVNTKVVPARPGLLITKELDISSQTGVLGVSDFCMYWKLFDFQTTEDVSSDYGILAGKNDPAIRYLLEIDQEPVDFQVWITPDNGVTWVQAYRLEPISFSIKTTKIRMAFMNWGASKIYLANYAVMF